MPPRNADFIPLGAEPVTAVVTEETHAQKRPPTTFVIHNIVYYSVLHLAAIYGLVQVPFVYPATLLFTLFMYFIGSLGITAGAHRLWAHRSYKANIPARILLAIFNSVAAQNDVIEWARDHRVHHKYSETDADPHNAKRGFFFAHMGWLMVRKHPDVKSKGRELGMDDLYNDVVLKVQRKYYKLSVIVLAVIMPTFIPWYYWGESIVRAYFVCCILRYVTSLNVTWCVNSVAHFYGNKPYDRHINPVESLFVSFGAVGEGFHNYHHTFPSDYRTSEFGWKLNITSMFIDFLAAIGWVTDRKSMSPESILNRKQKSGDGSHSFDIHHQGKRNEMSRNEMSNNEKDKTT